MLSECINCKSLNDQAPMVLTYCSNLSVNNLWWVCCRNESAGRSNKVAQITSWSLRHKNIEVTVDRDQGANRWTNTFWSNIWISFVNPSWPNAVWWRLEIVQGICGNVFSHKFWKKKRPTFLFVLHKGAMKWGPCTCSTFQSFQQTYHARNT